MAGEYEKAIHQIVNRRYLLPAIQRKFTWSSSQICGRFWTMGCRQELRASIERVLKWPFTKIIPAHGEVVPENGREVFWEVFRWA